MRQPEGDFKDHLLHRLDAMFPGVIILRGASQYIQGIPDIILLYKNKWAALEVKLNAHSRHQPNQDYYVDLMDGMSFAAFIFPENEEDVLDALQQTFRPRRSTRLSQPQ